MHTPNVCRFRNGLNNFGIVRSAEENVGNRTDEINILRDASKRPGDVWSLEMGRQIWRSTAPNQRVTNRWSRISILVFFETASSLRKQKRGRRNVSRNTFSETMGRELAHSLPFQTHTRLENVFVASSYCWRETEGLSTRTPLYIYVYMVWLLYHGDRTSVYTHRESWLIFSSPPCRRLRNVRFLIDGGRVIFGRLVYAILRRERHFLTRLFSRHATPICIQIASGFGYSNVDEETIFGKYLKIREPDDQTYPCHSMRCFGRDSWGRDRLRINERSTICPARGPPPPSLFGFFESRISGRSFDIYKRVLTFCVFFPYLSFTRFT